MSILFFILGTIFGSFGSVLITRLPQSKSIGGRSVCMQCGATLSVCDLIPLLSFLCFRGKCRHCNASIRWMYPAVECSSGILFLAAWHMHGVLTLSIVLALCLWLLLLIAIVDAYTQTISDLLNIPFVLLAIGYSSALGQLSIAGIALGAGFFGVQWVASRGKWLGSGDIILGAGMGALLGSWQHVVACLFLIYVGGAVIASVMLLSGYVKRGQYVAFAPFIVLGTMVSVFCKAQIDQFMSIYWGF